MNKVICDICGTAYPETASQCPICGNVRRVENNAVPDSGSQNTVPAARKHTKGGYFSASNVRKRNKVNGTTDPQDHDKKPPKKQKPKSNRGLTIAVFILLIAVLLVAAYIFVSYVLPMFQDDMSNQKLPAQTTETTGSTTAGTTQTASESISNECTDLKVNTEEISFDLKGRQWLIDVEAEPAGTTDEIIFETSDDKVATVTEQGRVTAVGNGKATITITCGTISRKVQVVCNFDSAADTTAGTTEATAESTVETTAETTAETVEPTTQETSKPAGEIAVYPSSDVTISVEETFTILLLDEFENPLDVSWSTDDSSICDVSGNTVTGTGSGTTYVRCTYGDVAYKCIVRVN